MANEITRRDLLKVAGGLVANAGLVLGASGRTGPANLRAAPASLDPESRYLNPHAEPFEVRAFDGTRYEVLVPDTLDLAEMAKSLIHAMTSATDPEKDFEVYWWAVFGTNPPYMLHQFSDQVQFQYMAVLPHMRLISGSEEGKEMETGFLAGVSKDLGPDGLFYNMPKARPWTVVMDQSFAFAEKPPEGQPFANLIQSAMTLNMLNTYSQISSDHRWQEAGRRCVDSLIRFAADQGDYAYYPTWQFALGQPPRTGPIPKDFMRGWCDAFIMLPLLQHYHLTGYEPAEKTARKLLNYYTRNYTGYDRNGNLLEPWKGATYSGYPLWASVVPLEWGLRTGDKSMLKTGRDYYARYRDYIEPSTGYYPEVLHLADPTTLHTAESCFLAYVAANAVLVSASGAGDYWEDVDRYVRNQFCEAQLKHVDWVERMNAGKPAHALPPFSTAQGVLDRNRGAFAGFMQFNDWFGGYVHRVARNFDGAALQHCCSARSATAIYNVWKNIVQYEAGTLRVNLLLNRASPWADIDSHIPYVGRVDVKVKKPVNLAVRIPEWVTPSEVKATVNGAQREISFARRYARLGDVQAGQMATLTFPITERDQSAVVHGRPYTLRIRGNTVVAIDPPGHYCPVYQRAHYREDETRWRKVQRFVAEIPFKEEHALCV